MNRQDKKTLERVAVAIQTARQAAGLSMSELARRIDDYPATIMRIEKQSHMPAFGLVVRLAEVLGLSLDSIIAEQGKRILSKVS